MENSNYEINIEIPFKTKRLAEIAYDVLRVDAEPKRSCVKKELSFKNNVLIGKFIGESPRQLRVAVNCFFDNTRLILETFDFTGPPVSEKYSHF